MKLSEDAVIKRMDFGRECDEYMKKMRGEANWLNRLERELIVKRYLTLEEPYDYDVYNEMGMSERQYYRIKARAFYNPSSTVLRPF
ncbi:ArpU family phage packaging/lysis transcriptional regulator [Geobacillus stearothermophilus]|uniref:ArpU family phage packaging/lysis transcriptional regulator n=1 Tax=Geobacillus stearothermophilus TaxID=1422 RepID=UPI003D1AD03A